MSLSSCQRCRCCIYSGPPAPEFSWRAPLSPCVAPGSSWLQPPRVGLRGPDLSKQIWTRGGWEWLQESSQWDGSLRGEARSPRNDRGVRERSQGGPQLGHVSCSLLPGGFALKNAAVAQPQGRSAVTGKANEGLWGTPAPNRSGFTEPHRAGGSEAGPPRSIAASRVPGWPLRSH